MQTKQAHDTVRIAQGSPDRFGYEWATYSEILPESQIQLQRWLGSVPLGSFSGKRVLDVGCGMGRNPFWMAKAGAKSVTAVDVDDNSLAAATKNLSSFKSAKVLKRSAYELDPKDLGLFDRVTCIGVLHHLSEPEEALSHMWSCVTPGGELILWCYAKEGNEVLLPIIQSFRFLGSRLPLRLAHLLAGSIAIAAWPSIQLMPWNTEYYRNLKKLSFKNVESIIFDQMIPKIANYWTHEDIDRLVTPLKGKALVEFVQGNSWHVRIEKYAH